MPGRARYGRPCLSADKPAILDVLLCVMRPDLGLAVSTLALPFDSTVMTGRFVTSKRVEIVQMSDGRYNGAEVAAGILVSLCSRLPRWSAFVDCTW